MAAADVREVWKEARILLSSVKNPELSCLPAFNLDRRGTSEWKLVDCHLVVYYHEDSIQEDGQAAQVLECAFRLLDTLFSSVESGKTVTLDSSDSTVVKAVLELVVRWGIYPHLSPGLGIPLGKRFGGKSAATTAGAISKHVSVLEIYCTYISSNEKEADADDEVIGLFAAVSWFCLAHSFVALVTAGSEPLSDLALVSGPPTYPSVSAPTTLLQSAELLASLVLDSTQRPGSFLATTIKSSQSDFDKQLANLKGNVIPPEIVTREEEQEENRQVPAAALHRLVIFYHLPDLCAAFMQLSNADQGRIMGFLTGAVHIIREPQAEANNLGKRKDLDHAMCLRDDHILQR